MIIKKGSVFISNGTRITDRFCKYLIINNVSQNYVDGSNILFDQLQETFVVQPFVSAKINMNIDGYPLRVVHSNEMFHFIKLLLLGEMVF